MTAHAPSSTLDMPPSTSRFPLALALAAEYGLTQCMMSFRVTSKGYSLCDETPAMYSPEDRKAYKHKISEQRHNLHAALLLRSVNRNFRDAGLLDYNTAVCIQIEWNSYAHVQAHVYVQGVLAHNLYLGLVQRLGSSIKCVDLRIGCVGSSTPIRMFKRVDGMQNLLRHVQKLSLVGPIMNSDAQFVVGTLPKLRELNTLNLKLTQDTLLDGQRTSCTSGSQRAAFPVLETMRVDFTKDDCKAVDANQGLFQNMVCPALQTVSCNGDWMKTFGSFLYQPLAHMKELKWDGIAHIDPSNSRTAYDAHTDTLHLDQVDSSWLLHHLECDLSPVMMLRGWTQEDMCEGKMPIISRIVVRECKVRVFESDFLALLDLMKRQELKHVSLVIEAILFEDEDGRETVFPSIQHAMDKACACF